MFRMVLRCNCKKDSGKQKGLQNFWEAQKWFEDLIPALRPFDLIVNKNAEQLKRRTGVEPAKTSNVTSRTPLAKFDDVYVIDLETTGLNVGWGEINPNCNYQVPSASTGRNPVQLCETTERLKA